MKEENIKNLAQFLHANQFPKNDEHPIIEPDKLAILEQDK